MKILIVRTSCRGASMKSVSYNWQEIGLARALSRLGHQCDIVFYGKDGGEAEVSVDTSSANSINLFFMRGIPLYDSALFFGLAELAKAYDIIQVAEYDQLESWRIVGRFPDKTVVYHGPYYSDFNRRYNLKCKAVDSIFLPRYVRHGTPFIAKSDLAADFLKGKGIKNVTAIGVGIDADQLIESKQGKGRIITARMRSLRLGGWKNILYIGRIEPRRNPQLLLQVLAALLQAGQKVHLTVVGEGDRKYVKSWLESGKVLGISKSLDYISGLPQGDLPDLYRKTDLFLLPTSYEIFGMVLLESMYFGVPAVTTANGGSSTLIKSWNNGIVINSLDPMIWAEVVSKALSDISTLAKIGNAASVTIRESFTWDALAPRFIEVYQRLLTG